MELVEGFILTGATGTYRLYVSADTEKTQDAVMTAAKAIVERLDAMFKLRALPDPGDAIEEKNSMILLKEAEVRIIIEHGFARYAGVIIKRLEAVLGDRFGSLPFASEKSLPAKRRRVKIDEDEE